MLEARGLKPGYWKEGRLLITWQKTVGRVVSTDGERWHRLRQQAQRGQRAEGRVDGREEGGGHKEEGTRTVVRRWQVLW
jgi:hypothetical protein